MSFNILFIKKIDLKYIIRYLNLHKYIFTMTDSVSVSNELKNFLILRSENSNVSPSYTIDAEWHELILNTKAYREFCAKQIGEFVHHNPLDSIDQKKRKNRLRKTYEAYRKKFGKINESVWNLKECEICNEEIEDSYFPKLECCNKIKYCDECCSKVTKCPNCRKVW